MIVICFWCSLASCQFMVTKEAETGIYLITSFMTKFMTKFMTTFMTKFMSTFMTNKQGIKTGINLNDEK